ncbi:MAG: hypothetical protein KME23_04010 [Goleter apudmare HA4340-LM2]|jgi:hypothetical protein|nr:hypothetical protein [Goleter apudmare HA4340-LM2]
MFNIKHLPLNCLYVGISIAMMTAAVNPASAQSVIVIKGGSVYQRPAAGYSRNTRRVYPQTRIKQRRTYYSRPDLRQNVIIPQVVYPGTRLTPYGTYDPYSGIRPNIVNPGIIYPSLYPSRNPSRWHRETQLSPYSTEDYDPNVRQNSLRYSTPVNPATVNNSWRRSPFRGRSRVILKYSY